MFTFETMKAFVLLLFVTLYSFSASAQSERRMKRFAKQYFNHFKKGDVKWIMKHYTDSTELATFITTKYNTRVQKRKLEREDYIDIEKDRRSDIVDYEKSIKAYLRTRTANVSDFVFDKVEVDESLSSNIPLKKYKILFKNVGVKHFLLPGIFFLNDDNEIRVFSIGGYLKIKRVRKFEKTLAKARKSKPLTDAKADTVTGSTLQVSDVSKPEKVEDAIFAVVEKMPEFPGGKEAMQKFIVQHIAYPQKALEEEIQGKVYVRFVVNKNGDIEQVKILRGIGGGCDQEAMKVVKKMPRWKPGVLRGKPVPVLFTLPVRFKLQD